MATYPGADEEAEPPGGLVLTCGCGRGDYESARSGTPSVFGTAREVTVPELVIEALDPAAEPARSHFTSGAGGKRG